MKLHWGRWHFMPGVWPALATAGLVVLTLFLGNWQTHRADYKRSLQAQADAAERDPVLHIGAEYMAKAQLLYRRVEVRGVFDLRHEILLDNRIYNGVAGYHVLTPLKIEGRNRYVLVNRGWVAVGKSRSVLPHIPIFTSQVKITGLAVDPDTRYFELGGASPPGRVWQNLNFERYIAYSGLSLQPFLLQQDNDTGDRLIRVWPRLDTGVAMHVSYALQWYGLATTLMVLWLGLNLKRDVNTHDSTH